MAKRIGRPAKEQSEKAVHQVKGYVKGEDFLFVLNRIEEIPGIETMSQYVKFLIDEDKKRAEA